jgi:hypothetical protein
VAVSARVRVPLPRRWRSERCGAEHDGESILIPHGARLSRDATEELVTGCTEAWWCTGGTETGRGIAVGVLLVGGAAMQSRDRGVATLES